MNNTESSSIARAELILAVTGDSPRSRRARANLRRELEALDAEFDLREIDLLTEPEQSLTYGIMATPALVHVAEGASSSVLYGDLSDEPSLRRFLRSVVGED